MEKKANIYNIVRILLYILLVGIPIRYAIDGFGHGINVMTCILMFAVSAAIIAVLEILVFAKMRKKLEITKGITQGNMYARTTESYRSANDVADREE